MTRKRRYTPPAVREGVVAVRGFNVGDARFDVGDVVTGLDEETMARVLDLGLAASGETPREDPVIPEEPAEPEGEVNDG